MLPLASNLRTYPSEQLYHFVLMEFPMQRAIKGIGLSGLPTLLFFTTADPSICWFVLSKVEPLSGMYLTTDRD